MQDFEIQNTLAELCRTIGETPTDIKNIAESGSSRKYYRIFTQNGSLIGTYSDNTEENEAFFSFSRHFSGIGLNVPKVLCVNGKKDCYLQDDFGDDNLFTHIQQALMTNGYTPQLIELFQKVLHHLMRSYSKS